MESSTSVKTFILPDKCFQKHIACVWRSGNKFSIYPRSQTTNKTQETLENKILTIRQDVLLFTPILRKLVNESNGTFLSLQKAAETAKATDNQVEFLKLSRQYRSIIRVCIENLQNSAENITDGIEKNSLHSYITVLYSIECVWHLCEILYIDNIPGDIVLPFLLEWVRFHFPCHEQTAAQLLEACERGSEDHPEYWDTVIGMIVQGRVDVARALLKLHSAVDSNEFKLVDNSLRSMPVFSVYGGISTGEYTISWKHWQAECRSKLTSKVLNSQPQLELVMRLITGEYGAFESIRDKYESWFDLVGGWVMYSAPWSRRGELRAAAAACAGMRARAPPSRDASSALHRLVRPLLDGDLHQVIHDIQQISDNGWFATHLTDILYHTGKLKVVDKHHNDVSGEVRDSLVVEYGSLLMEHGSMWAAGLSYLAAAASGPSRARLLLERLPLRTDARALRIIAEANKYGLLGVESCVCVSAGAARAARGARGAGGALAWGARRGAGRAGAALCARAARAALGALAKGAGSEGGAGGARGALPAADLLLTAGPTLLLADDLLFLGKYCEFQRLYKNREFKKAAKLLVSLITSKLAPDYFWETLLLDTLPLLESDEPVVPAAATFELMSCLELRGATLAPERAALLRLALSRNLSRVLLCAVDE